MLTSTENARFWDGIARKYARDPIKDMAGYERTLDYVRDLLRPTDSVLELGCGTGMTALRLAPHVAHIVGTDVSSEMIAIARERAATAGTTNARFVVAPAEDAPGTDASFEAVLAFNVLHLVTERDAVLRQALRLLKPGALFITKTACLTEMSRLLRVAVPVARMFGKAPHVSFFSADELATELAAAGFTIVERARHGSGRKDPRLVLVARKHRSS